MVNEHLVERKNCPSCRSSSSTELYKCPFTVPPIKEYLIDFYSKQGGVDLGCLDNGDYVLVECRACGLIYQRLILDSVLMRKLYEEWIDPRKALEIKLQSERLQTYTGLARDIELMLGLLSAPPHQLRVLDFGMGWGEWCSMVKAYGCNVHGVELSTARVRQSQESRLSLGTKYRLSSMIS